MDSDQRWTKDRGRRGRLPTFAAVVIYGLISSFSSAGVCRRLSAEPSHGENRGSSPLGACPSNRCSNPSESDSSLDYEQALSPLEYRSDAASAAECAGLRAQGPRLAVYRWAGAGEPGSQ